MSERIKSEQVIEFVGMRTRENKWHEVLALDVNDLSEWLQQHQTLQIHVAEKMGIPSTGAIPLDSWWQNWSKDGGFRWDWLLAGRGEELGRLVSALEKGESQITIRSRSEAESLAFLYGAMKSLPEGLSDLILAKTLFLPTLDAVSKTGNIATDAILIPPYKLEGHHEGLLAGSAVIYCGTTGDPTSIELPPVNSPELASRMGRDGVEWDVAWHASKAARTSVELMRKCLGGSAISFDLPANVPAKLVRTAVLCNRWARDNPADMAIIAELSGVVITEVSVLVRQLSETKMPLIRSSGKACFLTDEATAWYNIRGELSETEMIAFREVITKCLYSPDPTFQLPPEDRWRACLFSDKRQEPSGFLKGGIARSLAAIAEQDQPIGGYARGQVFVDNIVSDLLSDANEERWFSISHLLKLLAESSPEVFIEVLTEDLAKGQPASIRGLYVPNAVFFTGSSRHAELIFALERLCWNPDYLEEAARLLCDLHERQFGEENGNNPMRSLHGVFLAWHPATYADVDTRLRALESLRSSHPSTSWDLLVGLLPTGHETAHSDSKPGITRRQEWFAPTNSDIFRARNQTVSWVLEDAGTDPKRLAQIAIAFAGFPDLWLAPALDLLAARADVIADEESRYRIWDAMRFKANFHRRFTHTTWAMTRDMCDRYEEVMALYRPADTILQVLWLFQRYVELPNPDEDFELMAREVEKLRIKALYSVFSEKGLSGITALAARAIDPNLIGELLYKQGFLQPETEIPVLAEWLGSAESSLDDVAWGYCYLAIREKGLAWLNKALEYSQLSSVQKARLLQCAPNSEETWMLVAASGQEIQDRYWEKAGGWIDSSWSAEKVEYWINKLILNGRAEVAVHQLVNGFRGKEPSELSAFLLRALHSLLEQGHNLTSNWPNCSFDLSQAFRILIDSPVDQDDVAMLEYHFYPILEHDYKPIAFGKAMVRYPQLFLDTARLFYGERANGFEPTELERKVGLNAWEILNDWNVVPGETDGVVDEMTLRNWMEVVLAGAGEGKLRSGILSCIGGLLAHATADPHGDWPQKAICAVIEHYANEHLENGFEVGRFNLRGPTMRSYDSGGILERKEVSKYRNWATARTKYRRTRKILLRIADSYDRHAIREDDNAAIAQDLG